MTLIPGSDGTVPDGTVLPEEGPCGSPEDGPREPPDHVLRRTAEGIPLLTDRMLLELVNSVSVVEDLSRRPTGVVARLLDGVTGRAARADRIALGALAGADRSLTAWLTEVCEDGTATDLAVERLGHHLLSARRDIAALQALTTRDDARLRTVAATVDELTVAMGTRWEGLADRLRTVERRTEVLELATRGQQHLDMAVNRWSVGETYRGLPWIYQVVLIAGEVAGGPAGEAVSLGGNDYREQLALRLVDHPRTRQAVPAPFALARLIDDAVHQLGSPDRCRLLAELLDHGLPAAVARPRGPVTAALALAAELGALPQDVPASPGGTAISVVRGRQGLPGHSADRHSIVRALVEEQALAARIARLRVASDVEAFVPEPDEP